MSLVAGSGFDMTRQDTEEWSNNENNPINRPLWPMKWRPDWRWYNLTVLPMAK